MPDLNPLLILVALGVIIALLVRIAVLLNRGTSVRVRVELDDQLDNIRKATEHYVDVSSVVTMMRQLGDLDEDAEQLLLSYPNTVRAAASLHLVNTLGADLQSAQSALSRAHTGKDVYYSNGAANQDDLIQQRQWHVDAIRAKLEAAIAPSGQTRLKAE